MRKRLLRLGLILLLVVGLVTAGAWQWVKTNTYLPDSQALDAWERAEKGNGWYAYSPQTATPESPGVILYSGGFVDSRAYAFLAEEISEQANVVVVVPAVALNLVILNTNVADDIRAEFPQIERWMLGGHSLGAVGAAIYADSHPEIAGLFFWAGGSWEQNDLSETVFPVLSVHGTLDSIYTTQEWEASRLYAPPMTDYVSVEGGNHSYFGNYGIQTGDTAPTKSRAEIQAEIVCVTSHFIQQHITR